MITNSLSTLKIHKLTQEQYDRELNAGRIDETAIYLTPEESIDEQIDSALVNAMFFKYLKVQMPSSSRWSDITYGNEKFVAVASDSDMAAYSFDGKNWLSATLPSKSDWVKVAYGAGVFIAIAYFSNKYAYSYDGITWQEGSLTSSLKWTSLVFDEGYYMFYTVPEEGTACKYTMDGSDWGMDNLPIEAQWTDMTFDGSECVIVARNSNNIVTGNLASWTPRTHNGPSSGLAAVASNGNGLTVAIGADSTGYVCWSSNRTTWNGVYISQKPWSDITYGDGKFVIVASGTNSAAYSSDGANWTEVKLPSTASWSNVSYGGGAFVACAADSDAVAVSYDGITWIGSEKKILDKNGNDITSIIKEILS